MDKFLRDEDKYGLDVSTYIHDEDSRGVEFLNNPFGRNPDCGHEEGGFLLYTRTLSCTGYGEVRVRPTSIITSINSGS